jgi:hypothetical protein
MNNDELFEKIVKVIDEKLEPMKKDMATKADIHAIAEDMAEFFS